MPIDLQAKLLRAIQNKEITRVGGTKKINLDIRFIAATNSNLREKIREGQFRQDILQIKRHPDFHPSASRKERRHSTAM